VIAFGLAQAGGQHEGLRELFGLSRDEHRRLMTFLRKFDCLGPPDSRDAASASAQGRVA
jgi:hypothetical protein